MSRCSFLTQFFLSRNMSSLRHLGRKGEVGGLHKALKNKESWYWFMRKCVFHWHCHHFSFNKSQKIKAADLVWGEKNPTGFFLYYQTNHLTGSSVCNLNFMSSVNNVMNQQHFSLRNTHTRINISLLNSFFLMQKELEK